MAASKHINSKDTPITVCVDDHVYWKPSFLKALLPAFEEPEVGLVGTNKKVIRIVTEWTVSGLWASFTNFIACGYLERDNFRIRSEPYVDGAVFCVSGRTSAIRTEILQNEDYQYGSESFNFADDVSFKFHAHSNNHQEVGGVCQNALTALHESRCVWRNSWDDNCDMAIVVPRMS